MQVTYETLLTETANGIRTVTINRPDKLNALNKKVLEELDQAVQAICDEPDVRAAIITGAGPKAFVAGADIAEFTAVPAEGGALLAKKGQDIFSRIENCTKPIVAAVNGYALGGGCELAMACHFRLASETARFGQPEVNLGLIPGYGGTQRLTMLVGRGRALEIMLTGNPVSAAEARVIGLVNHVTAPGELLGTTRKLLLDILQKSPVAVSKVIAAVNACFDRGRDGYAEEIRLFGECFASGDKKEGIAAFLEKRKPDFSKEPAP